MVGNKKKKSWEIHPFMIITQNFTCQKEKSIYFFCGKEKYK